MDRKDGNPRDEAALLIRTAHRKQRSSGERITAGLGWQERGLESGPFAALSEVSGGVSRTPSGSLVVAGHAHISAKSPRSSRS